jgi:tRNA pseudouridine55 synthase
VRFLEAPPRPPPDPACALVNLDKDPGVSSRRAGADLARLFGQRRAGHAGTLDPAARGVLPVALGEATRFLPYLDLGRKIYRVRARLGRSTTTGDATGETVAEAPVPADIALRLERERRRFLGTVLQTPPMYAAVHHEGRRLYEWARRGLEVERPARPVCIDALDLEDTDGETFLLRVVCGPGTYVRVLVEDLSRACGTLAHVLTLERTAVGPFRIDEALGLDAMRALPPEKRAGALRPVAFALPAGADLELDEAEAVALVRGRSLGTKIASAGSAPVRLYGPGGGFLGLGRLDAGGALRVLRLRPTECFGRD